MYSLRHLKSFMDYKAWANDQLYSWLSQLTDDELVAKRVTIFTSILGTVNHIYLMDLVWQAHLKGRPHGLTTVSPATSPTLSELCIAQKKIDEWYIEYVDNLPLTTLDEQVNFTFIGGGDGAMKRSDILLHVVNHATYHRGHIDIIHPVSVAPPATDLPVFLSDRVV